MGTRSPKDAVFHDDPEVLRQPDNGPEVARSQVPLWQQHQPRPPSTGSAALQDAEKSGENHKSIGGMRARYFWMLLAALGIVVVAASVGGAVGGTRSAKS